MTLFHKLVLSLVAVCLMIPAVASAAGAPSTEPTILSVRGRVVRIQVPAGFERVTLERYAVPRPPAKLRTANRWRTLITKYPRGAETVLSLRLPTLIGKRYLRVTGNKTELLPGDLLTGLTSFAPDPEDNSSSILTLGGTTGILSSRDSSISGTASLGGGEPARTVAESDIWKVQGSRLYFFNELRGLQVFDIADPAAPSLLGTLRLPGSGEEMYLLGETHTVLLKRSPPRLFSPIYSFITLNAVALSGPSASLTLAAVDTNAVTLGSQAFDSRASATPTIAVTPQPDGLETGEIIVADVRAGAPALAARVPYDGTLAESRMVGSVLYLATNVNRAATDQKAAEYGLEVSSFDLADPANPVLRDRVFLGGWASAVTATDRFFLVAKYASYVGSWNYDTIDLIDISSSNGAMTRSGQVTVKGNVSSKFQMNIDGDVLTAVASAWGPLESGEEADPVIRWTTFTELQTFSIANPTAPSALGHLSLAPGETVRATRFDAQRAYVVTFRQIDPLFVVDLKDPALPTVSGHVEAPGFSTYIEPLGDRLVTIGLVNWQAAVSLFDVADPAAPKLLSQLMLGEKNGWVQSEAVWNEKAFKVLPEDNLILLPISGSNETGWFSGVKLLDLFPDRLVARGTIGHAFSPRRATLVNKAIVAIAPTRLVTVDAANRDRPVVKADLEIAWSVNRVFNVGRYLVQLGGPADWNGPQIPKLSVSPINNTDETLTDIDLANRPLIGSTVKDGVLYLAQGLSVYDDAGGDWSATVQPFVFSAYDLTRLPALPLLGSVTVRTKVEYGELTPLWPSPGVLVWAGFGGGAYLPAHFYYEPAPYIQQVLAEDGLSYTDETVDPEGFWVDRTDYVRSSRLLAFDVARPQAPKFLSEIVAGQRQPWEMSEPYAADGAVLFSYKFLRNFLPVAKDNNAGSAQTAARMGRHFLLRIDYADPAAPVLDDTGINVPGQLAGVAQGGKLLYTIGQNYDLTNGHPKAGESALLVSSFDGALAHLLDTLPLVSRTEPHSIQGDTVYTLDAQPEYYYGWGGGVIFNSVGATTLTLNSTDSLRSTGFWGGYYGSVNPRKSLLSQWHLNSAGKFEKQGEIETAHDTVLGVFGSLVVTQGERTLHLFDGSEGAKLESLGTFAFSGWVWPDLGHSAGGLDTGLWTPLGFYGVEIVAGPPAAP